MQRRMQAQHNNGKNDIMLGLKGCYQQTEGTNELTTRDWEGTTEMWKQKLMT